MTQVGTLRLTLRLICGESFALGPGKADLLAAIDREGSISGAGRAMGMSYRRAWLLVDEMNRCFSERVVETLSGGGRERGARLTETGRTALEAYRALEAASERLGEEEAYRTLATLIREAPVPAAS